MLTYHAKPGEVERKWVVVDATDMVLGRLSTRIAMILRGKSKPQYTPSTDVGDFVVVINAEKVRVTGGKAHTKQYFHHTGHPRGKTWTTFESLKKEHPGAHHRARREGHDAAHAPRAQAASQAESLHGRRTSARGADADPHDVLTKQIVPDP